MTLNSWRIIFSAQAFANARVNASSFPPKRFTCLGLRCATSYADVPQLEIAEHDQLAAGTRPAALTPDRADGLVQFSRDPK
jgi:hypothetical protein